MPPSSSRREAALALTLAAASWGLGTAISKRAVAEIPPLALLPIQLAASLFVLAFLRRLRPGGPAAASPAPPLLARLGVLNPGLAYALSLLGLVHISASLSVLLWALEPLLILVLARRLLDERFGVLLAGLSLTAVAGMVLVAYEPDSSGHWLGVALTVAGVACCAVYTIIARRWIRTADSTIEVVVGQQSYAFGFAVVVVSAAWVLGGDAWPGGVSPAAWLSAVVSGVLYYGAAYWLYLSGLRRVPAAFAAVSFYLIPVFGVAAGVGLLGERLDERQWIGVAVVVVAVAAIAWRAIREPSSGLASELDGAGRDRLVSEVGGPRSFDRGR
jgi:probable blue pigment (indigoidine) exporter